MKDFRVLEIIESSLKKTNQDVLIFVLVQVEYSEYKMPSEKKTYHFGTKGEKFVFDSNSKISREIIKAAYSENIVTLDMSDFTIFHDNINGIVEKNHIHKTVNLSLDSKDEQNKITESEFSKENPGCIHQFFDYLENVFESDNLIELNLEGIRNKYSIGFLMIKVEMQGEFHKAVVQAYKIDDKYFADRGDCVC